MELKHEASKFEIREPNYVMDKAQKVLVYLPS